LYSTSIDTRRGGGQSIQDSPSSGSFPGKIAIGVLPRDVVQCMTMLSANTLALAASFTLFESQQGFTAWPLPLLVDLSVTAYATLRKD